MYSPKESATMPAMEKRTDEILQSALTLAQFKRMAAERNVDTESIPPFHDALIKAKEHLKDLIRQKGMLAVADIVVTYPRASGDTKGAILLVGSTAREMLESDANSISLVAPIVSTFTVPAPYQARNLFSLWLKHQCKGPDTFRNMITLMVHQVITFETKKIRKETVIERQIISGVYKTFKSTDYGSTNFKAANTPNGLQSHDVNSDWAITIEHKPDIKRARWELTVDFKARGEAKRKTIRQSAITHGVPTPGYIVWQWFEDKAFERAAKHECSLWLHNEKSKIDFWEFFWGAEGKLVEKSNSQLIMGVRPFVDIAISRG